VSAGLQALLYAFGMPAIHPIVLARVSVPTTLLWGKEDTVVPLSVAETASERYGWPLHVIEQAGNEPAIEAPGAFVRALHAALEHEGRS
jgi:pimeloyl-ACP methyl ester carboxylesterase